MKPLFEHLAQTVHAKVHDIHCAPAVVAAFVEQFHDDQVQKAESVELSTSYPARLVLDTIERILTSSEFDVARGSDFSRRTIMGILRKDFGGKPSWLNAVSSGRRDWRLKVSVTVAISPTGELTVTMAPMLASWLDEFEQSLHRRLAQLPKVEVERERIAEAALADASPGDKILPPGRPLTGPYGGTLRDYSGCATDNEVADLSAGLEGCCRSVGGVSSPRGSRLNLVVACFSRQFGPMFFRPAAVLCAASSALICASERRQDRATARMGGAANTGGYNLLIVDVKGNMLEKLR